MKWKKLLPLIGIILFIYILVRIDVTNIFDEIVNANAFFLGISVLMVGVLMAVQTFKWFVIARKQKINVPFKEAFKINIISNFYGFITPSKMGNILRAEYLKKYSKSFSKGVSNFVIDKILDICSVFFLAIVFVFIYRNEFDFIPYNLFIIFFILLVFMLIIFLKKERSKKILKWFYRKLVPRKLKKKAKMGFESFYDNMPRKRDLVIFFILNIINWIVTYFITYNIALSLGINLHFTYFLAILPVGTIITLIPITVNGLGTREATLITLFSVFDIAPAKVVSMSLLALFITGIIPGFFGIFFSIKPERD